MRIGVLGGTFDPIHVGHLVAAEEVRCALDLEKVLFVPAGEPPHKPLEGVSPVAHRVRLVELSIASNPYFELSLVDVERSGRSYTVDTLEILRHQFGKEVELFFIIGTDSLRDLLTWRDPDRLIALAKLAVVNRPPYPAADVKTMEGRLPGLSERICPVEMPGIYVASSDLQRRVASGRPIRYQVPDAVEHYIREMGLYGQSSDAAPQAASLRKSVARTRAPKANL